MAVEDARRELFNEYHGVNELVDEVAGVEIEPERRVVLHNLQGPLGCDDIVGNLRGCTSRANFTPSLRNTSRIGIQRAAKSR